MFTRMQHWLLMGYGSASDFSDIEVRSTNATQIPAGNGRSGVAASRRAAKRRKNARARSQKRRAG